MIPFLDLRAQNQTVADELQAAFARVLQSGQYVLGSELTAFEEEFASYCGVDHFVGVSNCLDGLTLVLHALGIGTGDEVIVPSNTYIATWLAVSRVGASVMPVEPDEATYNIAPPRIEAAITERTRAIIAVHLYGLAADMDAICDVARRYRLPVIEDAAQGHGARCRGRRTGSLGHAAVFSFYPSKNLGGLGDGGGVATSDAVLADRLRVLRNYGSRVKYHNETQGYNCRLDELQAAFLRVKLRSLDQDNSRRRELADYYGTHLADVAQLVLPAVPVWADHVWHLFVVRHPRRAELQTHLAADGIDTLIHYPVPPHLQPAYASFGWPEGTFPVAERIHREVLSLPIGPSMTIESARTVAASLKRFAESQQARWS